MDSVSRLLTADGEGCRHPWWLWPNLLSLDAPTVSVTWLWALATEARVHLGWPPYVLLFLAVWCIYAGDRLWDVLRMQNLNQAAARHQFHARHFGGILALLILALSGGFVLAVLTLSLQVWLLAAAVVMGVGGYFWQLHRRLVVPKELACGFLFALGILCPLVEHWTWPLVVPALLAGVLVTANCLEIGRWERALDAVNDPNASTQKHPALNRALPWILLAGFAGGLFLGGWLGMALALTALALGALVLAETRADRELLRVLADFCLLMPVPVYLCVRLWS